MKYSGLLPILFLLVFSGLGASAMGQKSHKHGVSREETNARNRMVKEQIRARGVRDEKVLSAMSRVPRSLFVPEDYRRLAYRDGPLPIGKDQTISQPYIVALMTEALDLSPEHRVLEIGTGSGYQAAILAEIVKHVYTIEIIPELGNEARERLEKMGYTNITVRIGDGYLGWPEQAPFDAIMVTAAADKIPQPLIDQLKEGGRLCIPVGGVDFIQSLMLITKEARGIQKKDLLPVRFVPLVHPE